jgi:hypothetical protein
LCPNAPPPAAAGLVQVMRVVPGRPQSSTRTIALSTRIMDYDDSHELAYFSLLIRCRGVSLQHIGVACRSVRPSGQHELSSRSGRRRDQRSFSRSGALSETRGFREGQGRCYHLSVVTPAGSMPILPVRMRAHCQRGSLHRPGRTRCCRCER